MITDLRRIHHREVEVVVGAARRITPGHLSRVHGTWGAVIGLGGRKRGVYGQATSISSSWFLRGMSCDVRALLLLYEPDGSLPSGCHMRDAHMCSVFTGEQH